MVFSGCSGRDRDFLNRTRNDWIVRVRVVAPQAGIQTWKFTSGENMRAYDNEFFHVERTKLVSPATRLGITAHRDGRTLRTRWVSELAAER